MKRHSTVILILAITALVIAASAAAGVLIMITRAPEIPAVYNPLDGKILLAMGDSITGGYGLDPDPETGSIQTYPIVVGNRNNMTVYNRAISGTWMTSGRYHGVDVKGFSTYYIDPGFLPEEIDYLTIDLGANDWSYGLTGLLDDYCLTHFGTLHYESTAEQRAEAEAAEDWISIYTGSIDDTSVNTWCGAWNTVLTYLRAKYPQTKVGIMVPYPAQEDASEFADRLRATLFIIAEKYGYPTIDCGDTDQWFCIGYAQGLDSDIADMVAQVYTLDGAHPNLLGHQMIANSYEAWLKRI